MPTIQIKTETFVADGINATGREVGTCEMSFGHRTLTVRAMRTEWGVHVAGFVGRYRTSPKPWPASVSTQKLHGSDEMRLCVNFGRDDRAGRFHKQNAISYEPATYDALTKPEFWQPVGKE